MFDLGFLNTASTAIIDAVNQVKENIGGAIDAIRNFLGLEGTPNTEPIAPPFTPQFEGGQCPTLYYIRVQGRIFNPNGSYADTISNTLGTPPNFNLLTKQGAITDISPRAQTTESNQAGFSYTANGVQGFYGIAGYGIGTTIVLDGIQVVRADGLLDNCGDQPNPNPSFPPSTGLVNANSPDIGSALAPIVVAPPIGVVGLILAALRALAGLIGLVDDVLDGIRLIGEALKKITDLLDKLFGDKKKDDKEKDKNQECFVGEYYKCTGVDGFINLSTLSFSGREYLPYMVEFVAQSFPPSASRILGVSAPSICIDANPLFYLSIQDASYGIQSVKEIRALHSANYIPSFVRGVFYNYNRNPDLVLKYRIFYRTEAEEEEIEPTE